MSTNEIKAWLVEHPSGMRGLHWNRPDDETVEATPLYGAPTLVRFSNALQRIGTALDLPVGASLERDCVPAIERLKAPHDLDGYVGAFYEIGKLLGIGARPESPQWVFENAMLPKLRALAERPTIGEMLRMVDDCPGLTEAQGQWLYRRIVEKAQPDPASTPTTIEPDKDEREGGAA